MTTNALIITTGTTPGNLQGPFKRHCAVCRGAGLLQKCRDDDNGDDG